MNPVQYASLPSDACSVGSAGSFGPDRITKMVYDAAGQARQEIRAFGTSVQQVYATHDYEPDGKEVAIADSDAALAIGAYNLDETAAHAHQTNYAYDGFDRLITTTYADGTRDRVITYDNDGNVKKRKTRANDTITYTYDTNDRMATKTVPASGTIPANTVTWTYDLINEVTNLTDTNGNNLVDTYDLMGRQLTASQTLPGMTGGAKTVTYAYDDGAGDKIDRSQIQWPDGWFVNYNYDALGHMTSSTDSDGTVLATRTYDDLTRPATQQYPYVNDNISWAWTGEDDLATMTNNVALSANDVSFTNTFTPAHQWNSSNISNAAYKYTPLTTGTDVYTPDASGMNQYGTVTPAGGSAQTIGYDARGNLTGDGTWTYVYDPENHLMNAAKTGSTVSFLYDPLGRRTAKTGSSVTNFLHDGDTEIAEYGATGTLIRRFVPGSAIDQPIAMVTAAGVKTMFHTDKLGSVVAMSNATDGKLASGAGPYVYDSWGNCFAGGNPCSTTGTPYLYTGQRLDPETGLYYYRARYYSPAIGRFLQTDSIGYKDGQNWYLYTHDDPTNGTDPSGMALEGQSGGANRDVDTATDHTTWQCQFDPDCNYHTTKSGVGKSDGTSDDDGDAVKKSGGTNAHQSQSGYQQVAALGDLPPAPPGYDPQTWVEDQVDGVYRLTDPTGNRWLAHPEDATHWRHWDKQDPNGKGGGRWPTNSKKPWSNQKRAPYGGQSTTDPSGDAVPWQPMMQGCMVAGPGGCGNSVFFVPLIEGEIPVPQLNFSPGLIFEVP